MRGRNADNKKQEVEVTLLGEKFVFKGESPEHIKEVAALVNSQLEEVRDNFPNLGRNRVLILGIMKLGDALTRLKKENEELLDFFAREE